MIKIIVVEDDAKLNSIVCKYLSMRGYVVVGCEHPQIAFDEMHKTTYDLVVSDIMMPHMDGFMFAKQLRAINQNIPILFMSARDDISSKQRGYDLGIDDYMVKPIDLEELVLRVEALLRRSKIALEKKLVVGNLFMDGDAVGASIDGHEVTMTLREFNILYKLLSYPNHAFSRGQLMDEFWDADSETSLRSVDVYITKLRDKCSLCSGFTIKTVHGLGYKVVLS